MLLAGLLGGLPVIRAIVNPHAAIGWRIHCGVEVTELSTNKQHTLSLSVDGFCLFCVVSRNSYLNFVLTPVTVPKVDKIAGREAKASPKKNSR